MYFGDETYYVAKGMTQEGGSFVKVLGEALFHADGANARRIKQAFPEYWEQYLERGQALHKQESDAANGQDS